MSAEAIAIVGVGVALLALLEAVQRYGRADIFNTGQGSQFTSVAFTTAVLRNLASIIRSYFGPDNGVDLELPPRDSGREPPVFD